MHTPTTVVIGGTGWLGSVVARRRAAAGSEVVITGRDGARAAAAAKEIADETGGTVTGLAVDLSDLHGIGPALADVGPVDALVITATEQAPQSLDDLDVDVAARVVTTKLVGYTEAVRVLRDRFTDGASVVLFGGLAMDRPYPGSLMVTTYNGGVEAQIRSLALELAPHRVNAIHPGIVGDTPKWRGTTHPAATKTPIGRFVTTDEVAGAVEFLLGNTGMNAHNLRVDGGFTATS